MLLTVHILHAHEISPAVSDLVIDGDSINLDDRFSINAPEPLTLTLDYVQIPEAGNVELPRQSAIGVSANKQRSALGVTVKWPADYGALVIRPQGVEAPYTGYLENGGVSDMIFAAAITFCLCWVCFF